MSPSAQVTQGSSVSPRYEIVGIPSERVVSPGARITYALRPLRGQGPVDPARCHWTCLNDPEHLGALVPARVMGPQGTDTWTAAEFSALGRHTLLCEVLGEGESGEAYSLVQTVSPVSALLRSGPVKPLLGGDPEAYVDVLARYVEILETLLAQQPLPDGPRRDRHEDDLAARRHYRDALDERLRSTRGALRFPIQAEHLDAATQGRTQLRLFAAEVDGAWHLVDWTTPTTRSMTGDYVGRGDTAEAALRDAFRIWDLDNRYPNGGIAYNVSGIPGGVAFSGHFETDGDSFWDTAASYLEWFALGAAALAGVATFIAPVPGSRVVSAALWTALLSSSAAATLNLGQRHSEGFGGLRADAFDVLTLAGNLLGGGVMGILWKRGASVLVQEGGRALRYVFLGQLAADGAQGVLVAAESVPQLEAILRDATLTPSERTRQLVALLGSLALTGALFYVNVKGTRADLKNLTPGAPGLEGTAPSTKLEQLGDPDALIDTTLPPTVHGHTEGGLQTTQLQTEPDLQPIAAGGRARVDAPRTRTEHFKDVFGHAQYRESEEWLAHARRHHRSLAHLTDTELIAIRGYTLYDYGRINQSLREQNHAQLKILQVYIEEICSGLDKLPPFRGVVYRGEGMDLERFQRDFETAEFYTSPQFLSTSETDPFKREALYIITSSSGRSVVNISAFGKEEMEVLFKPGAAFRVTRAEITEAGDFVIALSELGD